MSSFCFPALFSAKFPLLFRGMSTCERRDNAKCPYGNKGANTHLNAVYPTCVFEPLLRRQGLASFVVVMVLFIGPRSDCTIPQYICTGFTERVYTQS